MPRPTSCQALDDCGVCLRVEEMQAPEVDKGVEVLACSCPGARVDAADESLLTIPRSQIQIRLAAHRLDEIHFRRDLLAGDLRGRIRRVVNVLWPDAKDDFSAAIFCQLPGRARWKVEADR